MPIVRDDEQERQERLDMLIEETRIKAAETRAVSQRAGEEAEKARRQAKATVDSINQRRRKQTS